MSEGSPELPPEDSRPARASDLSRGPLRVAGYLVWMFSTSDRQRSPPTKDKTSHIRLVSIGVSHFCEKTRWALDLVEARSDCPYYYTEDAHCPGFHSFASMSVSKNEASATPMIEYQNEAGESQVLYKSNAINKQFMPDLYPDKANVDAIEALEADFGKRLGSPARCFVYHHMLSDISTAERTQVITDMLASPKLVTKVERTLFEKMLGKGLSVGILKSMKITEESMHISADTLRQVFQEISTKLEQSGGEYIMDQPGKPSFGFTAADLTFCALASPIIVPDELDNIYPASIIAKLPKPISDMQDEMRKTAAGQHVMKMYAKHRVPGGKPGDKVVLKSVDRNSYPWQGWFGTPE